MSGSRLDLGPTLNQPELFEFFHRHSRRHSLHELQQQRNLVCSETLLPLSILGRLTVCGAVRATTQNETLTRHTDSPPHMSAQFLLNVHTGVPNDINNKLLPKRTKTETAHVICEYLTGLHRHILDTLSVSESLHPELIKAS